MRYIITEIDFNGFNSRWTVWTWYGQHGIILGHFKTREQAHIAAKYATKRITKKGRL